MFSASEFGMPLSHLTAKCSFTRTTLADLPGVLRMAGDASISGIVGRVVVLTSILLGIVIVGAGPLV